MLSSSLGCVEACKSFDSTFSVVDRLEKVPFFLPQKDAAGACTYVFAPICN